MCNWSHRRRGRRERGRKVFKEIMIEKLPIFGERHTFSDKISSTNHKKHISQIVENQKLQPILKIEKNDILHTKEQ